MKTLPKVLIVGINSFLAKAIYQAVKSQYQVIGAYHQNLTAIPDDITLVGINDLLSLNATEVEKVFIVSAFVPVAVDDNNTSRLYEANVLLPQKICNHFKQSRIVLCSSVSVYEGVANATAITEDTKVCPVSAYGISKLWGEQVVKEHPSYAILRISSMYGNGMKETTFLPKIINNALKKGSITLLGKGDRQQNYVHVNDVAQLAARLALMEQNGVLLAVGSRSYSNLEVAKIIQQYTNCNLLFAGEDKSPSYNYNNDNTVSTVKDTSFTDLALGIKEYIEWKKKQF